MTSNNYRNLMHKEVLTLKKKYENDGFKVIVNPKLDELPAFLKHYTPDLLAIKNSERVIIEVKSKNSIHRAKELSLLADVAREHGWRLDLVIINPKFNELERSADIINHKEISNLLEEVSTLVNLKLLTSAYMTAWIAFEATLRNNLATNNVSIREVSVINLLRNLYSYGYVSKTDYSRLQKYAKIRSNLVHGMQAGKIDVNHVKYLCKLTQKLGSPKK